MMACRERGTVMFEFTYTMMDSETLVALFGAYLLFITVPVLFILLEYWLTKKKRDYGLYLVIGVFASFLLFGLFSVILGLLVLVTFFVARAINKDVASNGQAETGGRHFL
jgi:hypothetical protein